MAWIRLENMSHLDHIAIKTNTNSLFFQENEGVNPLGLREGFRGRDRMASPGKVKKRLFLLRRGCVALRIAFFLASSHT
jgi:hypothetical protein